MKKPRNLLVTLVLSCLAWVILRFLRSVRSERPAEEDESASTYQTEPSKRM